MKVLIMPDMSEKKIIKETDRYYITEDSQFKKVFWANRTKEVEDEVKEEKLAPKKTVKKSSKKTEEKED